MKGKQQGSEGQKAKEVPFLTAKGAEQIKLLKELSRTLASKDQDDNVHQFTNQASALVSKEILDNKDSDVRLIAACCLADILRLFAPTPPYGDSELKSVFRLFIRQLSGLSSSSSSSYQRCFYLLERLSIVKAFVVLVDMDGGMEIIQELFEAFYNIQIEDHGSKVESYMVEILNSILDELDPSALPQEVLDVVLKPVLAKESTRYGHRIAVALLTKGTEKFKHRVSQFLTESLDGAKSLDSELTEQLHPLIAELYVVNPQLLFQALPRLEEELKIEEVDRRLAVVLLLGRMLAVPGTTLMRDYPNLLHAFLGRLADVDAGIRAKVVELAVPLFSTAASQNLAEMILPRFNDPDERVRKAAVEKTVELAISELNQVPVTFLEEVAKRMLDKKPVVRREAIDGIGKVYRHHFLAQYTRPALDERIAWIPNRMVQLSRSLPDGESRSRLESVVEETVLVSNADIAIRNRALVSFISGMDEHALGGFIQLLRGRKAFRADVNEFLQARSDLRLKPQSDDTTATVAAQCMDKIAAGVPEPSHSKAVELVRKLNEVKDNKVFGDLATLLKPDTTIETFTTTAEELVKRMAGRGGLIEFTKALIARLSPIVFKDQLSVLFRNIKETAEVGGGDELAPVLKFVKELGAIYPGHLAGSFGDLAGLIVNESSPDVVVTGCLSVFAVCGDAVKVSNNAMEKKLKARLESICETGSAQAVKHVIQAVCKLYNEKTDVCDDFMTSLSAELRPGRQLERVLSGLAQCARLLPSLFAGKAEQTWDMVSSLIKGGDTGAPTDDGKENTFGNVSSATKIRVRAIKFVPHFMSTAATNEDIAARAKEAVSLLFGVLDREGQIGKLAMGKREKEFVRLHAATALLRLAMIRPCEQVIDVSHYQQLAWVMQDVAFDVRRLFAAKLSKYSDTLVLPPRYLAYFVLAAADPEKENVLGARRYLERNFKLRRDKVESVRASLQGEQIVRLLPEYTLLYVIHLLAHHPDLVSDKDSLELSKSYLELFVESATAQSTDNFSFLMQILETVKRATDATPELMTDALYILTDLSIVVIKKHFESRSFKAGTPISKVPLPAVFYKLMSPEEARARAGKLYLPAKFRVAQAANKTKAAAPASPDNKVSQVKKSPASTPSPQRQPSPPAAKPKQQKVKSRPRGGEPVLGRSNKKAKKATSETPVRASSRVTKKVMSNLDDAFSDDDEDEDEVDKENTVEVTVRPSAANGAKKRTLGLVKPDTSSSSRGDSQQSKLSAMSPPTSPKKAKRVSSGSQPGTPVKASAPSETVKSPRKRAAAPVDEADASDTEPVVKRRGRVRA